MKHWLERVPETTGDFLKLALGIAIIFGVVWQIPNIAGGIQKFMSILSPFAWGVVLAYVLDIPARFFAQKLCKTSLLLMIFSSRREMKVLNSVSSSSISSDRS